MSASPLSQQAPSAFRYRGFRAFFVAASLSNGASWMQNIAVPVLLFEMTGKATWLGLYVVSAMLPAVALAAPAGVLGDRIDRRKILIATQILQLIGAGLMWSCYHAGVLTPGLVLGLAVINGIGTGMQAPVWQAFVPSLVPRESMVDAIRLNSMQFTIARVLGPAAAGVVVRQLGFGWAFGINTLSFVLPIIVLLMLRTKSSVMETDQRPWQALADGVRWVRHDGGMLLMLCIAAFTSGIGQSLQSISAAIADRVFGHPSDDNAILLTALGVGGVIAGLFAGRISRRAGRLSGMVLFTFVLYVVSPLLIGGTDNFIVGTVGFFVGGVAHLLNAVIVNSYLQTYVPDHLRGRIMGFYLLAVLGGLQVGAFTLGVIGDWIGVRNSMLLNAAFVAAVTAGLYARRIPQRLLDRDRELPAVAPDAAVLAVEQEV